jgi:histidinol-phosphate aminotransferase
MIEKLFRTDLKDFNNYKTAKNTCSLKMDANESFINFPQELIDDLINEVKSCSFNRYPDPDAKKLCRLYGSYSGIDSKNIMAGNGSDELIQVIVNSFIEKGDMVGVLNPDFSMYGIYTKISGGNAAEFPLNEDFSLDDKKLIEWVNNENIKILFLSNPNNPTGGVIPQDKLLSIIDKCNSIVVVDEAYVEFYGSTVINKIKKYSNLIVLRTCSKAFGLAAIRLGFLIAGDTLINEIRKAKPPFNVNSITQRIGCIMLKNADIISKNIDAIKKEREYLAFRLKNINGIKVYPTQSNFILIKCKDAKLIKDKLYKRDISIRNFDSSRLKDYLRISVTNRVENEYFLKNFMECRGDLNEYEC